MGPIDLTALAQIWQAAGPHVQKLCVDIAPALFAGIGVEVWKRFTDETPAKALAAVYDKWRRAQLETTDDPALQRAFRGFFNSDVVKRETGRVLRGNYADVQFDTLEKEMREQCEAAASPLPDASLHAFLETLLESLEALTHDKQPDAALAKALDAMRSAEPGHRNHSLARRAYLAKVEGDYGQLMLRGFERPENLSHVGLDRIFVMPRVRRSGADREKNKGAPALTLLKQARGTC